MFQGQNRRIGKAAEYGMLFAIGSMGYGLLETMWRGYTHISMLLTGGGCLCALHVWHRRHPHAAWWQSCLAAGGVITGAEFIVGVLVNRILRLGVWDYTGLPANLLGQICLPYSLLWMLLGLPIRWICRAFCRICRI